MTVMDPDDELPSASPSYTDPDDQLSLSSTDAPRSAPTPDEKRVDEKRVEEFSAFYRDDTLCVAAFLRWQGAGWAEAADATQEAMMRAYQRWDTLTRPGAWVRKVATQEFIRCRTRIREDPAEEVPEPTTALLRDPTAAAAEDADAEQRFLRLLDRLPARQRQVLAWAYDGYFPTEIAEQLSTPEHPVTPEAVRASLWLARRTLARHLAQGKDQL